MTLAIRWTRRALGRLDQIGAHIARDNPEAAARVVSRIVTAIDTLADRPAMGRPGRIKTMRELVLGAIVSQGVALYDLTAATPSPMRWRQSPAFST
jgi:plasmid stabilization system protein ParE